MSGADDLPVIIAVDPGRDKCGVAVVTEGGDVRLLRIVNRDDLPALVTQLVHGAPLTALLVGDGTASRDIIASLRVLDLPVAPRVVSERDTTLRARERYFRDNPPRGWRALVPRGLLLPPRAVDDYAALVIAEDWLRG